MLSCKHASRLISQSLDRRLTLRERISLRLHLSLCDVCTRFRQQLKQMRIAVKILANHIETDENIVLDTAARKRITQAIHTQP